MSLITPLCNQVCKVNIFKNITFKLKKKLICKFAHLFIYMYSTVLFNLMSTELEDMHLSTLLFLFKSLKVISIMYLQEVAGIFVHNFLNIFPFIVVFILNRWRLKGLSYQLHTAQLHNKKSPKVIFIEHHRNILTDFCRLVISCDVIVL